MIPGENGPAPALHRPAPAAENGFLAEHARLVIESYTHWTGRELVAPGAPQARAQALFLAPLVVASHGVEADPLFNYGNRAALALFEIGWTEFTAMPSRLSAEPLARDERARLLARVAANGYIDDYSGIRISASGRRFRIERATVWNLIDASGRTAGQAVAFSDWEYL